MRGVGRRDLLQSLGVLVAGSGLPKAAIKLPSTGLSPEGAPLQLKDFEPRSMLHVPETKVPRARYPLIDVHTHLSFAAKHDNGVAIGEELQFLTPVEAVIPLMDRKNIRIMVNLTGGVGKGLEA